MAAGDDVQHGTASAKLTYDDYLLFPEDGRRHEIIDGEPKGMFAAPATE